MSNAYIRLLQQAGRMPADASHRELRMPLTRSARYAPHDNWVRCRQCAATAAHMRDLVHAEDCLGQRVWRDGRWHWPDAQGEGR